MSSGGSPGGGASDPRAGTQAREPLASSSLSSSLSLSSRRALLESLITFLVVSALSTILFQIARLVPFVAQNLAAFVAAIFIYVPVWSARRRGLDLSAYGFTTRPHRRTIAFAALPPLVVFPLFLVAFVVFYQWVCGATAVSTLAPAGWCRGFIGWSGLFHPRAPTDLLLASASQLVVVALPEELFFRGYLLTLLETAFPPRRRLLGGGVGVALFLSAALFAVGHIFVGGDPRRLATFFPGLLFGWMRSASGNISAGTFVHASANLYIEALHRTFFA